MVQDELLAVRSVVGDDVTASVHANDELMTLAVGVLTVDVLLNVPISLDFSNWYAARSLCVVLGFVLIAAWGFYTSLAGQRLWKEDLFE